MSIFKARHNEVALTVDGLVRLEICGDSANVLYSIAFDSQAAFNYIEAVVCVICF